MTLSLRTHSVRGDFSVVIDRGRGLSVSRLLAIDVGRGGERRCGYALEALGSSGHCHNRLITAKSGVHVGGVLDRNKMSLLSL